MIKRRLYALYKFAVSRIHYRQNYALRLSIITFPLISLPSCDSWKRFPLRALYQCSHELMSRSEFHRYLTLDLISEIMAELFVRYITHDNSNTMGKRKRLMPVVGDGFRTCGNSRSAARAQR